MKPKEILVFGATGNIGRNLIRKLTKNNYKVVAVTRNIHQKGLQLKTQANPGYLELVELENLNEEKMKDLFGNCSVCVNLIGILYEKKKGQFNKIHSLLPDILSKIAKEINNTQSNIEILASSPQYNLKNSAEFSKINSKIFTTTVEDIPVNYVLSKPREFSNTARFFQWKTFNYHSIKFN